jgi:hypothetical protein
MPASAEGFIAVNRFGLGAKPGELETASVDPRGWLKVQLAGAPVARIHGFFLRLPSRGYRGSAQGLGHRTAPGMTNEFMTPCAI